MIWAKYLSTFEKERKKKKLKRKQVIVHVDDFLIQKLITPITLGEYFPLGFFNKKVVTSTHMVSWNEASKEDELTNNERGTPIVESSKTKEEKEVVASL